jgi:DNA-binding MarR family transcriptional regulator
MSERHAGPQRSGPSQDLGELTKDVVYQIRRLIQASSFYTKELNKEYRISVPQLNCLLALYENGPLPPSQIAKQILVKSSTVTGIIDRLEQKELVERKRSSRDRRVITIELTEAGRTLAKNAPPPIQQKIIDGLSNLSLPELRRISASLNMLTRMLEVHDLDVE